MNPWFKAILALPRARIQNISGIKSLYVATEKEIRNILESVIG